MLNIRVDDFLFTKDNETWRHNLDNFKLFDAVMEKHSLNYVLGVIPRTVTTEHIQYLKHNPKVEIALHGINHDERFGNEFPNYLTEIDVKDRLGAAILDLQEKHNGHTLAISNFFITKYIPPHNIIDHRTVRVLSKLGFDTIFGGPETNEAVVDYARSLGIRFEISEPPLEYGRSDELLERGSVKHIKSEIETRPVWLTLHWTWETNIGLEHLDKYLTELVSK